MRSEIICLMKVANAGVIFAHSRHHAVDIDNLFKTLYALSGPLAGFKSCEGPRSRTLEIDRFMKIVKNMSEHYASSLSLGHHCDSIYIDATSLYDQFMAEKAGIKFAQEEKKRKAEELRFSLNMKLVEIGLNPSVLNLSSLDDSSSSPDPATAGSLLPRLADTARAQRR